MGLMVGEYSSSLLLLLELLEVVVVVEQRGTWQLAGPLEVEAVQEEQEEEEEQLGLMQRMSEEVLLEQRTSNKKSIVIQMMRTDKRRQLRKNSQFAGVEPPVVPDVFSPVCGHYTLSPVALSSCSTWPSCPPFPCSWPHIPALSFHSVAASSDVLEGTEDFQGYPAQLASNHSHPTMSLESFYWLSDTSRTVNFQVFFGEKCFFFKYFLKKRSLRTLKVKIYFIFFEGSR